MTGNLYTSSGLQPGTFQTSWLFRDVINGTSTWDFVKVI